MTEHVDTLDGVLEFNRRRTIFGGVLNYLRRFSGAISSAFGGSSQFVITPNNHSFVGMASAPIDISSSDSDDSDLREIDNYRDDSPVRDTASSMNNGVFPSQASSSRPNSTGHNGFSRDENSSSRRQIDTSSRILPSWATSHHPNSTGYNGPSRKDPSTSSSTKRQIVHDEILPRPQKRSNFAETARSFSSRIADNIQQIVTSHEMHSHGKSAWSNPSNGSRVLPQTFMPGPTTFVDLNDGVGEERPAGPDESLVFQAAVQDLHHQHKREATLPDGLLSVSLLKHQKIALAWMLLKESSEICVGGILADDQGLGKTISTIALILMQKYLEAKSKSKDKESCSRTEALNLDDDGGVSGFVPLDDANQNEEIDGLTILPQASKSISKRPNAGTLIVCPASVLRQWNRELDEKVAARGKLSVLIYHGGNRLRDPVALAKYDVVLTTYAIVTNEVPKQPSVEEDDDELKDGERYGVSSAFSMDKKRKKASVSKKGKKGKKGKNHIDVNADDSNSGTLARVRWSRVVLDESQTIKNHRTQVARACSGLRAKRRWCLSGTPIQNSIEELFSYFRFLRYAPYDNYKTFVSSIKAFIARDSVKGYGKLQLVLKNIMLRRTKDMTIDGKPIINLPPKKVNLTRVEFSLEERDFYEKLEQDSRRQFKAYAAAGTVNQNYANILLMLLRLRQACDHPLLVKGLNSDPVGEDSLEMAKTLPRELLVNLLKQLETSQAICLTCRDPPEKAVVTMCGHVYCYQCLSEPLTGEDHTCPAPRCKEQLGADVIFSRHTLRKCLSVDVDGDNPVPYEPGDDSVVLQRKYVSSKIKSALEILKSCTSKSQSSESRDLVTFDLDASSSAGHARDLVTFDLDASSSAGHARDLVTFDLDASSSAGHEFESASIAPEKAIVFSQWTSMLDLIEMSLKKSKISYRRLDGTMSIAARDKAVKDFNNDPAVDVMLMSLKAGNLGLNMVAASRVILLDLWWNPTTEDQAVDRAHRIGQTRTVTVSRLTVKDTVEDRILSLQEDKRKMVASAFGEEGGGHATRLSIDDMRFLFEGTRRS